MAEEDIPTPRNLKVLLQSFAAELLVYGGLVLAYFFLVLHFLGGWLDSIFVHRRWTYAWVALALVVVQGLVLEELTRALLRLIRPGKK